MNNRLRTIRMRYPALNYFYSPEGAHLFYGGGSTWDATKYGDPNSKGGWFGLSKKSNPFSKGNMAGVGKAIGNAALSAGTGLVGSLGSSLISGGLESGAGSAISNIGGTIGGAVGAVNPIAGAAISAGSQLIGGLFNRAFGSKLNQENINKINESNAAITSTGNALGNVTSNDALLNASGSLNMGNDFSQSYVGKDGWFSNKAKRKYQELKMKQAGARAYAAHGLLTGAQNADLTMDDDTLSNFSAFGGPIETGSMGAIEYGFMSDYLLSKNKTAENKTKMTNMFMGMPNSMFAFGGDIQTNLADFPTGLTHINAGGTHEENPYDGVQVGVDKQGVPNLVEENEVIYDDYVFSNRLIVPRGMRGNYGKRNKYAKGGKLNKGNSDGQLVPYELEALKPFEGLTFADAAKKAEKLSGADERPTDPIAQRGLLAMLQVLAGTQEKEREKEKLQEIKDAIDSMTPEEFAMLQQQMKAQLVAQLQQEMAMQQLLMIPEGMELMRPVEQQQPISALGGILNTPDNMHPYGGSLDEFQRELSNYGLTLDDYLQYWGSQTGNTVDETTELTTSNLNRDIAEKYLNRIETITKQYNRRAKKQGIKIDDLQGATKAQYDRELNQAIQRGLTNADYDVSQDAELTFNNSSVSTAKNKQQAYSNAATYNDLIARGGRAVELDDLGRPTWESITGLNRIDNSDDNFYTNLGDLNNTALLNKGIYDYNAAQKSSIDVDDYNNVKLRGWNKNEDGTYTVSSEYDNPNQTSLSQGNSDTTYPIADIGDLKSGSDEYKEALKVILDNKDYKKLTDYIAQALEDAKGKVENLSPDVLNYIKYLDANSGNIKGKLLNEDGSLSATAAKDYKLRREDYQYGIYHYQFDNAKGATANRYYYKDKDKDGKDVNVYISKPKGTDFTISENPIVTTGTDGTLFNDYEVTGLNRNRTLTLLPTGEVVDVTNLADLSNWKKLDKPVLVDNTDNLGYGINGTTNWVDYGSNPGGASVTTENDPFPKAPSWPYLLGAGLQLGSLGYNILSPADYSNADAMIKAALDAGTYNPIEFRPIGNYLTYRPMDIWYEQNALNAQSRATDRALLNSSSPSRMAGLIANGYNSQLASGDLYRKALEYNDALRKQVGEFNKDTDKFNSEGFLKADMSNQDAATRARGYKLEGLKSGYAMRQAIDDAKANAINAGLTGLGTTLFNYALNKYNQDLLGWSIRHNANGPIRANGGRIRRYRGLTF